MACATWQMIGRIAYLYTAVLYLASSAPLPTTEQPKRKDPLEYFLYEELNNGTLIANVAVDAWLPKKYNSSIMSQLTYSFVNDDPKLYLFSIDPKTSIVKTTEQIDRDTLCRNPKEACIVWMYVGIHPEQYGDPIRIRVEILDKNDHLLVWKYSG